MVSLECFWVHKWYHNPFHSTSRCKVSLPPTLNHLILILELTEFLSRDIQCKVTIQGFLSSMFVAVLPLFRPRFFSFLLSLLINISSLKLYSVCHTSLGPDALAYSGSEDPSSGVSLQMESEMTFF